MSSQPPPDQPDPDPRIRAEAEARAAQRREARRLAAPPRPVSMPARPRFSQPVRQIVMMLIALILVGLGGAWAYGRIWNIFAANLYLNGLILGVFVLGVLTCLWQVGALVRSVSWIEAFARRHRSAATAGITPEALPDPATDPDATYDAPRLLAPLAALLGRLSAGGTIPASAAASMQDSVATRIEEARDITRYLGNTLIFLGLLGTFYGLATTVPAVVDTIRALAPQPDESAMALFDKLMTGLEAQLGGMATAFSSSLLGLAGSLVVGLLELFVTHGQNRFFRELEEWMTSFTSIALGGDDTRPGEGALTEFAARIAAHIDQLTRFYAERDQLAELEQIAADERALLMARNVETVALLAQSDAEARRAEAEAMTALIARLAEGQDRVTELLKARQKADADNAADMAIRSDQLLETMAELAAGQQRGHDNARSMDMQRRADAIALAQLTTRLADTQDRLLALSEITAEDQTAATAEAAIATDEIRARLRSLDGQLARLADDQAEARLSMQAELRGDLAMLTRALRRLGSDHSAPVETRTAED